MTYKKNTFIIYENKWFISSKSYSMDEWRYDITFVTVFL